MPRDFKVYIEDIMECITKYKSLYIDIDFESFCKDKKTVDAVIRNLEIIGEAPKNIPKK